MSKFVDIIKPVMEKMVAGEELLSVRLDKYRNVIIEFKENIWKERFFTEKLKNAVAQALKENNIDYKGVAIIQRRLT